MPRGGLSKKEAALKLRDSQNYGAALRPLEQLAEKCKEEDDWDADVFLALGDCYSAVGRMEEAIESYHSVFVVSSGNPDAHVGLAQVYYDSERWGEAQRHAILALIRLENKGPGLVRQLMGIRDESAMRYRLERNLQLPGHGLEP